MQSAPDKDSSKYWAAHPQSEVAAANVAERIRRYRQWLRDSGRADVMLRGFRTYYGYAPDGMGDTARTSEEGEQGEFVGVTLNKYATLVTQSTVRTTAEKPAFRAIPTNADAAAMEEATFGQGLLEYYGNTHAIADRDFEMVQTGNICLEGWQIHGWDTTKGKNLTDFAEGQVLNEGDIDVHASTPFRVAYDPDVESVDRLQWVAFKRRFNRFDLSEAIKERYPEGAQKLLEMSGDNSGEWFDGEDNFSIDRNRGISNIAISTDQVWVWEFRHLPTKALPNGRLLRFAANDCVVFDSFEVLEDGSIKDHGYPYEPDDLHAYRYSPETVVGSIAGHAASKDLLGLQELKDTVATQAASAANAGGISNFWTRTGDKPTLSSVVGGMNFIQSQTKPEILEGIELSAQIPAFDAMLDKNMQERMGESDASMGNVPKGMPGNLAALLEAKTVQYNSRGQSIYVKVLQRSRTGMLKLLQRFATTDRVAVLGGKANEYKHVTWSAAKAEGKRKSISSIDRFVVQEEPALMQTMANRLETADMLLGRGLITADQYLAVRATGRLEPATQAIETHTIAVRKEAEMLQDGIGLPPVDPAKSLASGRPSFVDDGGTYVRPLMFDRHWDYIDADLAVAEMPLMRGNAKVVQAVLGVVEERTRLMNAMSPVMLAMLGCPENVAAAISMVQMPPMPMGPDGAPPTGPKSPEVAGLPPGAPRIAAPKPAKPPRNPLTNEQPPSPVEGVQ